MFKTVKTKGGTYNILEQEVVESIMRQHSLIGLHTLGENGEEARRLGPYFEDYKEILTRIEFDELASLKTCRACEMPEEIRPSIADVDLPDHNNAEQTEMKKGRKRHRAPRSKWAVKDDLRNMVGAKVLKAIDELD